MRRLLAILLVSWVYAGCATAPTAPATTPGRIPGGRVRLLPSDPAQAEAIREAETSRPLAPEGLLRIEDADAEPENCKSFRLAAFETPEHAGRIDAPFVVASWETALTRPDSAAAWLLDPVLGAPQLSSGAATNAEGLFVDEQGRLVACTRTPTVDWPARLAHPGLWLHEPVPAGEVQTGVGPFRTTHDRAVLTAATTDAGTKPPLEALEFVERGSSDPAVLFDLGLVDLAIVSGRSAGPFVDGRAGSIRVERLARWDTVYAIWFGTRARWVNDPRFRAWIAGAVDRESMLRLLFDGRGEPAFRLSRGGGPEWSEPPTRPFSQGSLPRLSLRFESADPEATSIAARLKAVLEQEGLEILLQPASGQRFREALGEDDLQMALVAHRPPVADPVLALQDTLWRLGIPVEQTWELLVRASWWEDDRRRSRAALFAEDTLLQQARLVPLVRLHVWMAVRSDLQEVSPGAWGVLGLDRAWWAR